MSEDGCVVSNFGKYEVRRIVGRGAIGTVYEGWDPIIARTVAIKVVPMEGVGEIESELLERFRREAQAAGRLQHPNIVAAFDYGETDEDAYIVMEYVSGPSLRTVLFEKKSQPLATVGRIMSGLLAGLHHSHSRGVVHRDIKPSNIMFSADGEVKITDFGIAHLETSGMTRAGTLLGTPAYMAPEQVLSEKIDARTDLYSAGVVLYEMLTGRRPFEGGEASVMHKIIHEQPARPSELAPTISRQMDALIAKALAKAPVERFQTATEFNSALNAELDRTAQLGGGGTVAPGDQLDATVQVRVEDLSLTKASATGMPPPVVGPTVASRENGTALSRFPGSRKSWHLPMIGVGVLLLGAAIWFALTPHATKQIAEAPAPHDSAGDHQPAATSSLVQPPSATNVDPPRGVAQNDPVTDRAAVLLSRTRKLAATTPCALPRSDMVNGRILVGGLSALGITSELEVQAMLRRAIQGEAREMPVDWNIRRIDGPYCPVFDLLRPIAFRLGQPGDLLSARPTDPRLKSGTFVQLQVATPDQALRIALDWFASDGTVRHLHALPVDGQKSRSAASWTAGKPYGDQLITVIQTSAPLFKNERPEQEPAATYITDLRSAVAAIYDRDTNLTADALAIDVEPQ